MIRGEEEYLAGRFGQAWLEYRAKVGALVPFVRWP
jgi:protein-S-isoprenylcysteine O-methyltransferase Ste14